LLCQRCWATRQANPAATGAPLDPDWAEAVEIGSDAALVQLREDQKREVRSPAHIIGLGAVASLI
jgi:hypothetical protein